MQSTLAEMKKLADAHGQGHLFAFWDRLDDRQRAELLADVSSIRFKQVASLIPTHVLAKPQPHLPDSIEPCRAWPANPDMTMVEEYVQARALGVNLIKTGKVAAMVVAGGQGSRLGFEGPKGIFPISVIRQKPLFQLFCEAIVASRTRYGSAIPLYVMTSPSNDAETRRFFEDHGHFGLPGGDVMFFTQGVMPALGPDGKILLEQPHRVCLSPDGHGGSILALARSGALADMARRGIEHISYFQVDNPLVYPIDPLFIGLHEMTHSEMSTKVVPKADDLERVGNVVIVDGKTAVIEYSNLPAELAHARGPKGGRLYDAGNVAIHCTSRRFVERLTKNPDAFALPWHRADKKVAHVDLATGRKIEPGQPNAVKLETFVFDALPLADSPLVFQTHREEEFSPVKNATGADSAETSRRDLNRRAARWLSYCGAAVPRRPDGEPDGLFEISPLLALSAEHLKEALTEPPALRPGGEYYFE